MPITGFNSKTILDIATIQWVNAVITNGGSVSAARTGTVNALISSLKIQGLWSMLDYLWILAAENETSALIDLVANVKASKVSGTNSVSFTADDGYTGVDGSGTCWLDTGINLITGGASGVTQYTQNNAHISAWSFGNASVSGTGGALAGTGGASGTQTNIFARYSDNTFKARINDSTLDGGAANSDSTGHWQSNRTGSAASQGYHNGTLHHSPNTTSGSITGTAYNHLILAINNTTFAPPVGAFCTANTVCMASVGAGMTSTQATNFYNALRTYMTAVGVP